MSLPLDLLTFYLLQQTVANVFIFVASHYLPDKLADEPLISG